MTGLGLALLALGGGAVYLLLGSGLGQQQSLGEATAAGTGAGAGAGEAEPSSASTPAPDKAPTATLSAGGSRTCGLDAAGAAWCWGSNFLGMLGDGWHDTGDSPVRVVAEQPFGALAAGAEHTCGLDIGEAAWCWGSNYNGQLGKGLEPRVQPTSPPSGDAGDVDTYGPVRVAGGQTFTTLAAGGRHTCGVDGARATWCWGSNYSGQLGTGAGEQGDELAPVRVAGQHEFTSIAAGSEHTCALDTTGVAWCWGDDLNGELGSGANEWNVEFEPVPVAGGQAFTTLAAGGYHTCGIDAAGVAWCWGSNYNGQLGTGDSGQGDEFAPVRVAGQHEFTSIAAGSEHTCALDTAGEAWCWGHGPSVGDGDDVLDNALEPVPVVGGHTFTTLAAGRDHTCGIGAAGLAWCWGVDDSGELGDGDGEREIELAPVQVVGGHTFAGPETS